MTASAVSTSWEPGGTVILTGRGFEQDALAAMSTDIIRGLVEAITNADDKYFVEGIAPGRITVLVERRHGPWTVSIRDRAGGMTKQELIDKIAHAGGRTSGFEEGFGVRGNRGRGAKDLAAFGPVMFESIKAGKYAALKIESHGQWSVTRKPVPATEEIRERLGLPRNSSGTVVTIHVREAIRCPRLQKIREKTQSHYQLRDVMRDPSREVLLVNATRLDEKYKLHYGVDTTKLEPVLSTELDLPDYPAAEANLALWRLGNDVPERPASDPYRPQGVLIAGQRAIYDNTLFAFEGNTYAHRFTGRLECPYIDQLIREFDDRRAAGHEPTPDNPQPLISRTRDGLVRDHPFFQQLRTAADIKLQEVVDAEEQQERRDSGSVENEATKRALSQAARTAARYLRQSLQDLDDEEPLPPGDDVQFAIRPPRIVVEEGAEKTLSIVAPRDLFEEGREVELVLDPEGIVDLVGSVSPLGPHRARDDLLSTTVRVRGVLADQATILTASAGSSSEVAWIDVIPAAEQPEPEPPEQFEFEKDRYRIRWQKRKRLTLQAPLDSSLAGVELRALSDNDGVVIIGPPTALQPDSELGYLTGHVNVEARKLHARGAIEVHAGDAVAACRVQTSTQEDDDIDLEIRLQPQLLGSFRSTIKEETVNGHPKLYLDVMTKHPTLSRYIGDPPAYTGQNSLHWRALLAEIIAEAIVRRVLEKKYPVDSQGIDAEAFFVELFQRTTELAPRIHRELLPSQELNGSANELRDASQR